MVSMSINPKTNNPKQNQHQSDNKSLNESAYETIEDFIIQVNLILKSFFFKLIF
jgi:hypothetical protein